MGCEKCGTWENTSEMQYRGGYYVVLCTACKRDARSALEACGAAMQQRTVDRKSRYLSLRAMAGDLPGMDDLAAVSARRISADKAVRACMEKFVAGGKDGTRGRGDAEGEA